MAINPLRKGGPDIQIADGGTGASDAATARTNLGAGDLTTAAHAAINHTGLPGVPGVLQAKFFNWAWDNSSSPMSTGALGFTPKFIIVNGVAAHNNDGTPTMAWTGSQLASTFSGIAISATIGGVVTAQQHNTGNSNDQCAGFRGDQDWVGGNPPAGDVVGAAVTVGLTRRLTISTFSSSNVTLAPSGLISARAFVLVVGV